MLFAWDITIAADTVVTAAKEQNLKLSKGVIVKISVKYPSGCHGLVKMRLQHRRFQIVPLTSGEWLTGDDEAVDFLEYYELSHAPYELKFIGVSSGTTFPHTLAIRIVVLPKKIASFYPLVQTLQRVLERIFGPAKEVD